VADLLRADEVDRRRRGKNRRAREEGGELRTERAVDLLLGMLSASKAVHRLVAMGHDLIPADADGAGLSSAPLGSIFAHREVAVGIVSHPGAGGS
jgi:hypothetical protein